MIEAPVRDVFAVITEFLADDPSDEELLAFVLPDDMQTRVRYLLEQNREAELTGEERRELDDFVYADNMISLLKTKIKLRQSGKSRREEPVIDTPVRNLPVAVAEFLTSDPTDDELLAYMFPEDIQARVHFLLDRNGAGELTCDERHELDDIIRANRMMTSLKINRELRLKGLKL